VEDNKENISIYSIRELIPEAELTPHKNPKKKKLNLDEFHCLEDVQRDRTHDKISMTEDTTKLNTSKLGTRE
jgi:hypothetical protein